MSLQPYGLQLVLVTQSMTIGRLRDRISRRGNTILVLSGIDDRGRRRIMRATKDVPDVQFLAGNHISNPTGRSLWVAVIGSPRRVVQIHNVPLDEGSGARVRLWIDFEKPSSDAPDDGDPLGVDGAVSPGLGDRQGLHHRSDDAAAG